MFLIRFQLIPNNFRWHSNESAPVHIWCPSDSALGENRLPSLWISFSAFWRCEKRYFSCLNWGPNWFLTISDGTTANLVEVCSLTIPVYFVALCQRLICLHKRADYCPGVCGKVLFDSTFTITSPGVLQPPRAAWVLIITLNKSAPIHIWVPILVEKSVPGLWMISSRFQKCVRGDFKCSQTCLNWFLMIPHCTTTNLH